MTTLTPRLTHLTCKRMNSIILISESVDEILWCDYSKETPVVEF